MPHELDVSGVFLPPALPLLALALISAWCTALLLNRYRLARYFYAPQLAFLSFVVMYFVLFSTFLFRG